MRLTLDFIGQNAFQAVGLFGDYRAGFIGEIRDTQANAPRKAKMRLTLDFIGRNAFLIGGPGGT